MFHIYETTFFHNPFDPLNSVTFTKTRKDWFFWFVRLKKRTDFLLFGPQVLVDLRVLETKVFNDSEPSEDYKTPLFTVMDILF